jgi:hypothetical protein
MAPSTTTSWPLMQLDSSLARNTAAWGNIAGQAGALDRLLGLVDLAHDGGRPLRRLDREAQRFAYDPGGDRARRDAVDQDAGLAEFHRQALVR